MFAYAEALIELRIDPQFGAAPQPHAREERRVGRLAALTAMRQAVGPLKRRSDCGVALPNQRRLAVKIQPVLVRRRRRLGDHRQCVYRHHIVAELIIQAGAYLLQRKIGIEPLRATE